MFGAILLFSVYLTLLAIVGIQGLKTGRITLVSFAFCRIRWLAFCTARFSINVDEKRIV